MKVQIKSYDGFDVRGIEVSEAEAREVEFSGISEELFTVEKWTEKEDFLSYNGPSDQCAFYVSIDGCEEDEITEYEITEEACDENDEIWIEAVAETSGYYTYEFDLDEDFNPEALTIHFQNVYDADFSVATGMAYMKSDGSEIYIDCDDFEARNWEYLEPMIHNN